MTLKLTDRQMCEIKAILSNDTREPWFSIHEDSVVIDGDISFETVMAMGDKLREWSKSG
jgi:hypothetical protein